MTDDRRRRVCNYEGSHYRTEFWGQGREYEDAAERVALRHLLPPGGSRLIDIGGGYGRLVPLYRGYDEVVIFDYALSQLHEAQELWGRGGTDGHPRYTYVAGDFYKLPFARAAFQTVVMVRTLHHASDARAVLQGVSKILEPGGHFILEFANKRNLKAIVRYLLRCQGWSPFDQQPVEFVPLNFDFHPAWIEQLLIQEGLQIQARRAVSTFRIHALKRLVPTQLLVTLDRICQPLGNLLPLSPSVFVRSQASELVSPPTADDFLCCPACGGPLEEEDGSLVCTRCDTLLPVEAGIHNFKAATAHHATASTGTPDQRNAAPPHSA